MRYLFHQLASLDLPSLGADSAVPGLNRNIAYMTDVLVPSAKIIEAFEHCVEPIWQRETANAHESHILTTIRDALLPKLISGEIRSGEINMPISEVR
jgi:type I restriction enzyme S subunit